MHDLALSLSTYTCVTKAGPRASCTRVGHSNRGQYTRSGLLQLGSSPCLLYLKHQTVRKHPHINARRFCTRAAAAADSLRGVDLVIERGERNSRRLYGAVQIAAPVETVWGALTDYEGLSNFIPGLAENRCLKKKPTGATLLQVGEQDVAFGAKFRARVVLDIQEHAEGTPRSLCSGGNGRTDEQLFPLPRGPSFGNSAKDVCFTMIEGDFQIWLPVRLIQSRIEGEVKNNLAAVRQHSERLCNSRRRPTGAQQR